MLTVILGGSAPLWRDREIRARHTASHRRDDGRFLPVLLRHAAGLWLRRQDEPYGNAEVHWEAPLKLTWIPPVKRATLDGVGVNPGGR